MIERLKRSELARNFLVLLTGTALAQIILIAISPLLTRLFSAEAFGIMGIFLAFSTILGTVSNGRYDLAIMLPSSVRMANRLLVVALLCPLACAVFLTLLLPTRGWVAGFFETPGFDLYLLALPLSVMMIGVSNTLDHWLARDKCFKAVSAASVCGAVLSSSFMLGAGLVKMGAWGLVIGGILNHLGKTAFMAFSQRSRLLAAIAGAWTDGRHWWIARRYADFPAYRVPQDFINALSQHVPILLLGAFFGPASVGFFWLANRVLILPALLISQSLRKVLYQKTSELSNAREPLFGISMKFTLMMLALASLPFAILITFGEWLFGFVFGAEWRIAGSYASWIAIWALSDFIKTPAFVLVPVLRKNRLFLFHTILTALITFLAMWGGTMIGGSDVLAVAVFSVAMAVMNLIFIVYMLYSAKRYGGELVAGGNCGS